MTQPPAVHIVNPQSDITMTCVSNTVGGRLVGAARWLGVPVKTLLDQAGPSPKADQVLSIDVDDFRISTPLAVLTDDDATISLAARRDEIIPGTCDARADRPDRATRHVRGLRVRQPHQLGEHERLAPLRVQRGQHRIQRDRLVHHRHEFGCGTAKVLCLDDGFRKKCQFESGDEKQMIDAGELHGRHKRVRPFFRGALDPMGIGALQGFIVFFEEAGHMLLENVAVFPRASGRGVGRALIEFCEQANNPAGIGR